MDTQANDFKKRLAEKKKRYKLSTSMGGSDNVGRAFKNIGLNINNENKNTNKSIDLAPEKEFAFSEKDMPNLKNAENFDKGSGTNNTQVVEGNNNNILDELKKEDLKENGENKIDENNLNDSFENKLDLETKSNKKKLLIKAVLNLQIRLCFWKR